MSKKSYQVIEPQVIGEWLGTVKHEGILFALLSWLVHLILSDDDGRLSNVEVEVICVEYDGKYPAIGVHYKNPDDEDLEEYITSSVDEYLRRKPVLEFVTFAFNNNEPWADIHDKFIS